jgi:probable F420-dependent oxidoreductase
VKIDALLLTGSLDQTMEVARRAERLGFDGAVSAEVAHDPFLSLTLAAAATDRVRLQTGIAVAFARNPMTVAIMASDLQRFSQGRFTLGLGSQIRPHITRRFSMPWSQPALRMREFVLAIQLIWRAWETGDALSFESEFYQHTLMTPMFSHGVAPFGVPRIFVAGVGPAMTAVAGEVADGYLAHGCTTPEYLRAMTLPQLETGLLRTGRSPRGHRDKRTGTPSSWARTKRL